MIHIGSNDAFMYLIGEILRDVSLGNLLYIKRANIYGNGCNIGDKFSHIINTFLTIV